MTIDELWEAGINPYELADKAGKIVVKKFGPSIKLSNRYNDENDKVMRELVDEMLESEREGK